MPIKHLDLNSRGKNSLASLPSFSSFPLHNIELLTRHFAGHSSSMISKLNFGFFSLSLSSRSCAFHNTSCGCFWSYFVVCFLVEWLTVLHSPKTRSPSLESRAGCLVQGEHSKLKYSQDSAVKCRFLSCSVNSPQSRMTKKAGLWWPLMTDQVP